MAEAATDLRPPPAQARAAAALFGWAIYSTTPAAVSAVITMTAGQRITSMRAQQKELMMKWGPDVESVYEPAGAAAQKQATAEPMAQKR